MIPSKDSAKKSLSEKIEYFMWYCKPCTRNHRRNSTRLSEGKSYRGAIFLILMSLYFIGGCTETSNYVKVFQYNNIVLPERYNIILILFDSIRADHLSCYGYNRRTSPAIDKVAGEGILFEQAISQSTWSLPSQCSILTSKYVPSHGIDDVYKKLSDSELTLAEVLKIYGYKTAAFTGGFWISSVFNVGQGFDVYYDKLTFGKMNDTFPIALDWLKHNKDNTFFLLLQGFDGHSPFNLPKEYEEKYVDPSYNGIFKTLTLDHNIGDRLNVNEFFLDYSYKKKVKVTNNDIEYIIDNYDGSIAYADKCIGDFLKEIEEFGLKDNTIIILTSYHGTPLFKHGVILRRQHSGVTEGTIRVPLIIRHPQFNGGMRISLQAQQIDIMPTILDFIGIPINHQVQGRSLIPLIEGKADSHFNEYTYVNGYKEVAIRTNTWKLIKRCVSAQEEDFELYNLQTDPGEKKNLIGKKQKIAGNLKIKLNEWFKQAQINTKKINLVTNYEVDKIKEEMKKAGYWFIHDNKNKEVVGRESPERIKASEGME